MIEFAIATDVTEAFYAHRGIKAAVAEVPEEDWQLLYEGEGTASKQQWVEVCFVPNWLARSKHGPDYRFLAIREPQPISPPANIW